MKMKRVAVAVLASASFFFARGRAADAAAVAPATVDTKADAKSPKTLAEADPELRKKLTAMLEAAKKEAREKMDVGVDKALAKRPKISNEMAQLLRSSSTHETWVKLIVDGALKANSILLNPALCAALYPDEIKKGKTPLELQYERSCIAISRMRDVTTGLEGDAFIEEYISTSIAQSQGTEKSPGDKDAGATADKSDKNTRKHKSHVVQDTNGMIQAGGN